MSAVAASNTRSDTTTTLLDELRQPIIINYDTEKYPFRKAILAILQEDCMEDGIDPLPTTDLSKLHEYSNHPCSTFCIDRAGHHMSWSQTKWNIKRDKIAEKHKGIHNELPSKSYAWFNEIYQAFIREVIGPSILQSQDGENREEVEGDNSKSSGSSASTTNSNTVTDIPTATDEHTKTDNTNPVPETSNCDCGDSSSSSSNSSSNLTSANISRRVLYQQAPTFRVYLANEVQPMGKLHTDEEYHHQPSELNCWMPISDHVGGNNSLWVESTPGKGDYAPLVLQYGQIYRGYLNQCRHYTEVNNTGFTRVSVDFRVVSDATGGHNPNFHKGVRRGAKAMWQRKYDIGGFYHTVECEVQSAKC